MIADLQALTDNADNPEKIRQNILEVMLDYLAVGLEPDKTTFFVQSHIPALYELPMYYSNLVGENTVIGENAQIGARPETIEDKDSWGVAVVGNNLTVSDGSVVAPKAIIYENI